MIVITFHSRLGELYGRLYEHQNLTRETHDTLYELFGIGALGHFNQLSKCFRAGKLVDRKGNDTYLPGLDKHGKLDKNARSKDWVKNVDVPILMFCGEYEPIFAIPFHSHKTMLDNKGKFTRGVYLGIKQWGSACQGNFSAHVLEQNDCT